MRARVAFVSHKKIYCGRLCQMPTVIQSAFHRNGRTTDSPRDKAYTFSIVDPLFGAYVLSSTQTEDLS